VYEQNELFDSMMEHKSPEKPEQRLSMAFQKSEADNLRSDKSNADLKERATRSSRVQNMLDRASMAKSRRATVNNGNS
jgi:hypothetical protein